MERFSARETLDEMKFLGGKSDLSLMLTICLEKSKTVDHEHSSQ